MPGKPDKCPNCGAPSSSFHILKEEDNVKGWMCGRCGHTMMK